MFIGVYTLQANKKFVSLSSLFYQILLNHYMTVGAEETLQYHSAKPEEFSISKGIQKI